jgi:hypothetical protein
MRFADDVRFYRVAVGLALAVLALLVFLRSAVTLEDSLAPRFGYTPDPEAVERFMAELDQPRFAQAGAECMEKAKGVDTLLYRAMFEAHRARYGTEFVVGRQLNGSCVAWGAMHGVFCAESVSWKIGELAEPPLMPATEPLYGGSRVEARRSNPDGFDGSSPVGGWSDGSFGAAAARWLRDWGVVYRKPYPGIFDYTTYDATREKHEGAYGAGGQGDNYRLDKLAKKHPCKHVVKVETWDELAAALEAGYPCTVASSQGFESVARNGIAEASGTWHHQMLICGILHKKNGNPDDLVVVLNSWGPRWCRYEGAKLPADLPDGAFLARRSVVERMIRGDTWAIGGVSGFGWRDVHHGEWLQPAPDAGRRANPARLVSDVFKMWGPHEN